MKLANRLEKLESAQTSQSVPWVRYVMDEDDSEAVREQKQAKALVDWERENEALNGRPVNWICRMILNYDQGPFF